MLWAGLSGGLEVRQEGGGETRLSGRFPYGRETVLAEGGRHGRARKEVIAARAFARRVGDPVEEIHLLVGHDFDRPLASRSAGTLRLEDGDDALAFEARIAPGMAAVSWVSDLLASARAGLIVGLSPGFRIAPEAMAEVIEERADALVRTVKHALLFELSAVTRPAYPTAQIEARSWQAPNLSPGKVSHPLNRWRL